jgi:hypothetical protein
MYFYAAVFQVYRLRHSDDLRPSEPERKGKNRDCIISKLKLPRRHQLPSTHPRLHARARGVS